MRRPGYRAYLLGVLLVIYSFSTADQLTIGIVLQDIKKDLDLSDLQLGMITGGAFAVFYAIMGVPIARWADRGNRVRIIAIAMTLWSIAVGLYGLATNFLQLLVLRVCVAVGEAGCTPSAMSLIADYYDRAERPRAMAMYMQGGSLSLLIGFCLAGWLNQFWGWRAAFMVCSLPCLALVPVVLLTLKEPRRATVFQKNSSRAGVDIGSARTNAASPSVAGFREVVVSLWSNRTFRCLVLFWSVGTFFNLAIARWQPTFFIRSYGLKTGELGTWFAAIYFLGSALGLYLGGELASRYATNNERLQLAGMSIAWASLTVLAGLIYISPSRYWAFAFALLWCTVGTAGAGPLYALMQSVVPAHMRATAVTIFLFFGSLIGGGLGPLAAGALSDAFRPWTGAESLRFASLALTPGYFWGAWYLWQARGSIVGDLDAAVAGQAELPALPNLESISV